LSLYARDGIIGLAIVVLSPRALGNGIPCYGGVLPLAKKGGALTSEERRRKIISGAARAFAEKGYRATSVTDIVEAAGVARGTFYHYFQSKQAIFAHLVDSYFEQLSIVLENNSARLREAILSGQPPLYAWQQNTVDYLRFHKQNPQLTTIIYQEAMAADIAFSQKIEKQAAFARRKLASDLELVKERGLIIPCDTELVATFIAGSAVGLILTRILSDEEYDVERLAFELVKNQSRALATSQKSIERFLDAMEERLFGTSREERKATSGAETFSRMLGDRKREHGRKR